MKINKNIYFVRIILGFVIILPFMVNAQTPLETFCAGNDVSGYKKLPNFTQFGISSDIGPINACTNDSKLSTDVNVKFLTKGTVFDKVEWIYEPAASLTDPSSIAKDLATPDINKDYIGKHPYSAGNYTIIALAYKGTEKYKVCRTFTVNYSPTPKVNFKGCPGEIPSVTIPLDPKNVAEEYIISWSDGKKQTLTNPTLPITVTHPYDPLAKGNISVEGWVGGLSCPSQRNIFSPQANNPVFINRLETKNSGTEADIAFTNFITDRAYVVEMSEDDGLGAYKWIEVAKDAKNGSISLSGNMKSGKNYCFRINSKDDCGNNSYSNTVCSISLYAAQKSSSEATITWNNPSSSTGSFQGSLNREVIEGCSNSNCITPIPLRTKPTNTLDETKLECDQKYKYQINYQYSEPNGKVIIVSPELILDPRTAVITLKPSDVVNVGFMVNDEETIQLFVENTDSRNYTFFRSDVTNSDFVKIGTSGTNNFDDIDLIPNSGSYCYKYQYTDACDVTSEISPEFCTVYLDGDGNRIYWSPYSFPKEVVTNSSPVEYFVEVYDSNLGSFVAYKRTDETALNISDLIKNSNESSIKFRIQARQYISGDGFNTFFISTYSNVFVLNVPPAVFTPTAFTPNFDSENDIFTPHLRFVSEIQLIVYDRWGGILFESDDITKGWDGTESDHITPAPVGNYAYQLKGVSEAGESFNMKGTIMLIR